MKEIKTNPKKEVASEKKEEIMRGSGCDCMCVCTGDGNDQIDGAGTRAGSKDIPDYSCGCECGGQTDENSICDYAFV